MSGNGGSHRLHAVDDCMGQHFYQWNDLGGGRGRVKKPIKEGGSGNGKGLEKTKREGGLD